MKNIKIKGYQGYPITIYLWDEVKKPKGIVQLSHGMGEHLERYNEFANFLNGSGYIVIGDDHRGHGLTAGNNIGRIPLGDCFTDTIKDMKIVNEYMQNIYDLPVYMIAHSYGSFLAQGYIIDYSNTIDGLILSGSAFQKGALVSLGQSLAKIQARIFDSNKPAKLLDKMAFSSMDKEFKDEGIKNAWLTRDKSVSQKYNDDPACGFIMPIGFYKSMFNGFEKITSKNALALTNKSLPILIAAGEKDPVNKKTKLIKKLHSNYINNQFKNISLKIYKDARHEILNEINKGDVYQDFVNFIDELNNNTKA